jgi:hypothetical protein
MKRQSWCAEVSRVALEAARRHPSRMTRRAQAVPTTVLGYSRWLSAILTRRVGPRPVRRPAAPKPPGLSNLDMDASRTIGAGHAVGQRPYALDLDVDSIAGVQRRGAAW